VQIDLTRKELQYIRAALTLVVFERDELIDTGRFAKELGEDTVIAPQHESAEYEETLRAILLKLPAPEDADGGG
jgi:hypothetical protein